LFQRLYAPDPVQPLLLCTSLGYHICVNLPLLLLAVYFEPFVTLAAASMCVSLGACVIAAAQASLPRRKERLWSRPLVVLLFFLQPIVRGWARYKSRLNLLSGARKDSAKPLANAQLAEVAEVVAYWSPAGLDRYMFLRTVLSKLEQGGWPFKMDTGWTSHDLEIPAQPWGWLRLTTVAEELEQGKTNIRCRIGAFWSVPARIFFWACLIAAILLITTLAATVPWIWMSLVTLPLICWWIDEECRCHAVALREVINGAANDHGMIAS
jgi:hypothetical protein